MKKYIAIFALLLTSYALADWPHKNISQAVFAKSVEDRTPIAIVTEADNSLGKIYFFTNIRNLKGSQITHRWVYKDKIKAEVSFSIKGNRWRVWSSKNLWHTWTGQWRVEVVDQNNQVLLTKVFNFRKNTPQESTGKTDE